MMKKLTKYIIPFILAVITFFLIYPKSELIDFVWLVGSAISPGIGNSITGWFVFFFLIGMCYGVFYSFYRLQKFIISKFSPKGIDLDKLDKEIDKRFDDETSKSLGDWLTNKRNKK